MRVVPDEDLDALAADFVATAMAMDAELKAKRPGLACIWRAFRRAGVGRWCGRNLVRRLTGTNQAGVVSYGTEAGQFQEAGYSAVVCEPGDIAQAHQADEYLELSEWQAGQGFMAALLANLA